jgi:hypothetical protein
LTALLRSPHTPHREKRLLGLLDDLVDDLDVVDLDTVDGEFYWRVCRTDLLDQVEALYRRHVDADPDGHGTIERLADPEDTLAALRLNLRQANSLYGIEAEACLLYPRSIWRRLLQGERVALRAAESEVGPLDGGREHVLRVKVFSGAWTGQEVEAEVRRQDPERSTWLDGAVREAPSDGAVRLAVEFAFTDECKAREESGGHPVRFPYVVVTTPLPVPPPGVISREYQALVCGQRKWHLALPGGGTRQEKEVALRTWAVGWLVAKGTRFGKAMREVCQLASFEEVSQTRFGEDRKHLLERVPEAKPYLYARQSLSDVLEPNDRLPHRVQQIEASAPAHSE